MTRHRVTMIEVRMLQWIDLGLAASVHLEIEPAVLDTLDGPQLAVGQLQVGRRRGELHPVAAANFPVVSGARMLPILAWVYRSNSDRAERTLSRCATLTRSSPPTRAVNETDFGAENVASHPARCSTLVTSLPNLPS